MSDKIWARDEIESPCIKVCVIHPASRLCTGCLRSIDEITEWSRMTPEARAEVMAELPTRQGLISQRRGGRARTRS
ncbi:hypothetical protein PARPLA_03071 [Rhodobacteraceae bacterium THAF1]|uniref:DUF1289 domain-containing protein n=1 Tax=Palleronia sp. THAF1 TaxID=2587842 RepID=UPI000F3B81E5|nr:DUF1289 domain-containing protein [Palleronia sp. THAF1]QFU08470.1 hypothetical protein FIU81_07265 [Palleronia sp. THAF1]VDC29389.1 hypothetical protein PARPLA_03071 [Rhodobacteraceae bacterium THAF1]